MTPLERPSEFRDGAETVLDALVEGFDEDPAAVWTGAEIATAIRAARANASAVLGEFADAPS